MPRMKKKQPAKRVKRNHKFQLNINKPFEAWLDEWIPVLKTQKKFSQYVRDGLQLMIQFAEWGMSAASVLSLVGELREGKTDKLFELFPHIQERVVQAAPTPQSPLSDTESLAREIATQIILQGGKTGMEMVSNLMQPPIKVTVPAAPKAEMKQSAVVVSAEDIADNFLNMFN